MLNRITSITDASLSEVILESLIRYLDFSFASLEGVIDVAINQSNYKGAIDQLFSFDHPSYNKNQFYVSRRKNWVWESIFNKTVEVRKNGAVVNPSLYKVNYSDGGIIFNSDQLSTDNFTAAYSYKYIDVVDIDGEGLRAGLSNFSVEDSIITLNAGSNPPHKTIQMPGIAIEAGSINKTTPYEIGNTSQNVTLKVVFSVLSNQSNLSKRIAHYIFYQKDHSFSLFDPVKAGEDGFYALNYDGTLNDNTAYFTNLVTDYPFSRVPKSFAYFEDCKVEPVKTITPGIYQCNTVAEIKCVLT